MTLTRTVTRVLVTPDVAARLVPTRIVYARKGFRAKLSAGWYAWDKLMRTPVDGPHATKAAARRAIVKFQEAAVMGDRKTESKETTRSEETHGMGRRAPEKTDKIKTETETEIETTETESDDSSDAERE